MGVCPVSAFRRAVFLDRDGVLNKSVVRAGKPFPPSSSDEIELIPGVKSALRLLRQHGFELIVITNQPDVARGTQSRSGVEQINLALAAALPVNRFYVCYHDDDAGCSCRKPKPGLFFQAASTHAIDLSLSFAIGDRWRDVDSAESAGVQSIFIDYNYDERRPSATPRATVANVLDAARWIVSSVSSPSRR